MSSSFNIKPMLNAYPDSIGQDLKDIISVLKSEQLSGAFQSFYILPSVFNSDLDRGFSIVDYSLNNSLATKQDFEELSTLDIDLKLDFILNHASVLSPQFQDIVKNGESSKYLDFFIRWNKFWENEGEMSEDGYIVPKKEHIEKMFFRKPGLPLLMVKFPNGLEEPYWNTFYQQVKYQEVDAQDIMELCNIQYYAAEKLAKKINQEIENGKRPKDIDFGNNSDIKQTIVNYLESNTRYLGQMDLNINSPLVWEFYDQTFKMLSEYGAAIVRLDAFAYAPKQVGKKNFLNTPDTWELLSNVQTVADKYKLNLLPEIHANYSEKIHETLCEKGYTTYDFFLPGLIIDALEHGNGDMLQVWGNQILEKQMKVVNMLGCHDGIPLLDLKGLLKDQDIENLIDTVVSRGGYVKNLDGQKNMYYQVNATYYSALGEDDDKMLLARAIQMFMPGKPQVWYLDLFAGENDHQAVELAGAGGHKEINRSNLSLDRVKECLNKDVVAKQIELLRFRNSCEAFDINAKIDIISKGNKLDIVWNNNGKCATLNADLTSFKFKISSVDC